MSAAELARHAMAAGDRERTLRHSRGGGRPGPGARAPCEEAVEHLERALSLWSEDDGPAPAGRAALRRGRLRARLARGDERAVELLELAVEAYRALGDEAAALWCLARAGRRALRGG